jgi:hypothetical protein
VVDDAALFCPYCGIELAAASVPSLSRKQTGFPMAAGILTIIAACICAIVGIFGTVAFVGSIQAPVRYVSFSVYFYTANYQLLFVGIFGILAFAFGWTGGIFSIKGEHFALSIVGISLVLVSGFVTMIAFPLIEYGSWGLLFGLPVVILSILSGIFTAISKGEFV